MIFETAYGQVNIFGHQLKKLAERLGKDIVIAINKTNQFTFSGIQTCIAGHCQARHSPSLSTCISLSNRG